MGFGSTRSVFEDRETAVSRGGFGEKGVTLTDLLDSLREKRMVAILLEKVIEGIEETVFLGLFLMTEPPLGN